MYTQEVSVQLPDGLHTRAAALFIQTANKYNCSIHVAYNGQQANAKSLLGILALGVDFGARIALTASGFDEKAAVQSLAALCENPSADSHL
ncbi:MAG: HPr family phosphocarrier protein [Oscillospiraceae bacterium]|nr:HPr family phosphocarrier protein [Oscillospiraceae bacterium]